MPSTMPLRVGDDLLTSAKLAADASGRSAAQQIGYWAKLGRELERSGSVSVREIADVLAGARSYDELDSKAQAVVRAEWAERTEARRAALNLADLFAAEGRTWVEMDADGKSVRRAPNRAVARKEPDGTSARAAARAAPTQPQRKRQDGVERTAATPVQRAAAERSQVARAAKSAQRAAGSAAATQRTANAASRKGAQQPADGKKAAAKKPARRSAGRAR